MIENKTNKKEQETIGIPKQLQRKEFRFVRNKPKSKEPIDEAWQTTGNFDFDSPEIKEHLKQGNVGIVCGINQLAFLDGDTQIIIELARRYLPPTMEIVSGNKCKDNPKKQRTSFAFYIKNWFTEKTKIIFTSEKFKDMGDLRFYRHQILIPPSIHPTRTQYKVIANREIAEVSLEDILAYFKDYIKSEKEIEICKEDLGIAINKIVNLSSLNKRGEEFFGTHPVHGSENGKNFWVNPSKGEWHCFRCGVGGGALSLIAVLEGIIKCHEAVKGGLRGEKFKETLKIAKEKYGLKSIKPAVETINYNQKPELKDFLYFKNLKKDKRFLVQDFIFPKTLIMLFSPPAGFKSILALGMAIQITAGKTFLDLKTKKFPVLLCDKENSEQDIKDRWEKIRKGHGIRKEKYPLWILQDGSLDDKKFIEYLKQTIKEKKIKLLILDTLHRFSDYQENKADDINRIYTSVFQPIKENYDCSILFLHHTTKDGGYRGSSDFLGMVDCAYSLVRKGKSNSFELICEKNRRGEIEKRYGEIEFTEDSIEIIHTKEEEKDNESNTKFTEVARKVGELYSIKTDSWKRQDIFSQFKVFKERDNFETSESTLKSVLSWLVKTKVLARSNRGEYARNWEKEFSLWQKTDLTNENVRDE